MSKTHQLVLDPSGHVLIPHEIRARLGLAPGMTLVVEERNDKELLLRLQDKDPPLIDKEGVLVVQSRAIGDVTDVTRWTREARVEELVQRAKL